MRDTDRGCRSECILVISRFCFEDCYAHETRLSVFMHVCGI